jgi:hypothetical protein
MSNLENRYQRRMNVQKKRDPQWKNKSAIATDRQLFESENELPVWSQALKDYQVVSRYTKMSLQLGLIMRAAGVDADLMRGWYGYGEFDFGSFQQVSSLIAARGARDMALFDSLRDGIRRFKTAYSNDEYKELWALMYDPDIYPLDIVKESYRYTTAMCDLTAMHVEWLKGEQKKIVKSEKQKKENFL